MVLATSIDVPARDVFELHALPPRRFGLLILDYIWRSVIQPRYRCEGLTTEHGGCDAVVINCRQKPLAPHACLENKYVENFWLREGVLYQEVRDASAKLKRARRKGNPNRYLLVSSFALRRKREEKENEREKKIFKGIREYVLVVILVKSDVVEKDPALATQEIVDSGKDMKEVETLDSITNIGSVLLYDKLADLEDKLDEKFDEIETEQQAIRQEQQAIRQEQQAIRQEQRILRGELTKIKEYLEVILDRLDKKNQQDE